MLKQAMRGMFGKGGMPPGMDPSQMDPKALEAAAKQMGGAGLGKMPGGLPGLGSGALPPRPLGASGKRNDFCESVPFIGASPGF